MIYRHKKSITLIINKKFMIKDHSAPISSDFSGAITFHVYVNYGSFTHSVTISVSNNRDVLGTS